MKKEHAAFAMSFAAGAVIWALSRPITGKVEPWDANSAYYYVALALAGFGCAAAIRAPKRFHYVGAVTGQVLYMLLFLRGGGLMPLGIIVLFVYTLVFLAGAAAGARLRR